MRLGFAIAAFLQADVLLLDEVFAVGDENFQRKCFGVIAAFKNQGGTILFVSHDAQAVERLCERSILLSAGEKAYDGPTHEAIARYRRLLADDLDPAERSGGLREWGTGEAEITGARLLDADGDEREQFLAGEPLRLEVDLRAHHGDRAAAAPPRGARHDRPARRRGRRRDLGARLAGRAGSDDGDRSTSTGRRSPSAASGSGSGSSAPTARTLHQFDDALAFLVYPDGEERGLVHLGGTWRAGANQEVR